MACRKAALCSASVILLGAIAAPALAQIGPAPPPAPTSPPVTTSGQAAAQQEGSQVSEIVVTAQKRQENINNIGLSVTAQTGQQLTQLGITDTASLSKVTPGLNFTPSAYGTPVYTIRGIGFQDTSLAASPTVSVYTDEVPLPFSIMTQGASLDVQRVEVLKGPQGTLFGENATGGAINYVANKPTDHFTAGLDASYGRFDQIDFQGYVSGPITDTLSYRVSLRRQSMDDWQHSYSVPDRDSGQQDFWNGRAQLQWKPNAQFTANLTLTAWQDKSDTQVPQFYGIVPLSPTTGVDPRLLAYPLAPHNDQAADRNSCVNTSPFNAPFNTIPPPYGYNPPRPVDATTCSSLARDNTFYSGTLHLNYDLPHKMTLTSLTSYESFYRNQPLEGDGTIYQDYESLQRGHIDVAYQEVRLAGDVNGRGDWIVGANYEYDASYDNFLQSYDDSSANPSLAGLLGPTQPENHQTTNTYAVFGNIEYPILDNVSVHGGLRFTESDKSYNGCAHDSGDGTWSRDSQAIQNLLEYLTGSITAAQYAAGAGNGVDPGPGACATTGPGPTFNAPAGDFTSKLDQNNVSWRVGVDYHVVPGTLLYANVSKGYKSGGYPTVATSTFTQLVPATQEELLAYEVGAKSNLFDHTLQINGAVFYYDYTNKQILGDLQDPVFGALPALVNVPKSDVIGFELSGQWTPIRGLVITPGVSYAKSRVKGDYYNFDPFTPTPVDFKGEPFPDAPPWQADLDAQYEWPIMDDLRAFVGLNANYQSSTREFFYNRAPDAPEPENLLGIPSRTLLDLRAGVERGRWRLQFYGRNVTDVWYWTQAAHTNDALVRYTGMPATYGVTVSFKY